MTTTLENTEVKLALDLKELATDVVRRAMQGGATAAECVVREGDEFSTVVRLGEVETLKEAGSRALGVRVFFGQRTASTYTSDLSLDGVEKLVSSARDLAQITSEDPFAGLPDATLLGQHKNELNLFYPDVYSLPGTERIDYARRAEKASLDYDPRIKNSEGGSFDASTSHRILANSLGFLGEYRRAFCSLVSVPIVQSDDGAMQRDYWYHMSRSLRNLESPEHIR